jgi:hypothetical protein
VDDNNQLWNIGGEGPGPGGIDIFADENGRQESTAVWTGTRTDGTGEPGYQLGIVIAEFGVTGDYGDTRDWLQAGQSPSPELLSLYGISGVLTVVPEPSTIVLACLAATGLAVSSLRRRRHCRHSVRTNRSHR